MGACSKTMHTCNTPLQQEPLRSIECLLLGDFGGTRGLGRDMVTWRFQQQIACKQLSFRKSQLFSANFQGTWGRDIGAFSNRMQGPLLGDSGGMRGP